LPLGWGVISVEDAMRIQLPFAVLFAAVFTCTMHADPAQAQRVFVSATGSDGNPCTFASPCRSFQHAHDTTAAGGEIDVLDPAGYGALTITKAISIQGHGFSGVSVASGANGITINAGPSDAVTLNGLLIEGAGIGYNGIVFNSGASLAVSNCVVQNFFYNGVGVSTGNGIYIHPTSGTALVTITNTIVQNNQDPGILWSNDSGSPAVSIVIDHVVATANQTGMLFAGGVTGALADIAISNSVASNNSIDGIGAGSGKALTISIDNSTITGNNFGIDVGQPASVLLSRSVIQGNSNGTRNLTSNTFYTYGNNLIDLNGTNFVDTALNSTVRLR
jgi:hypothetical protein